MAAHDEKASAMPDPLLCVRPKLPQQGLEIAPFEIALRSAPLSWAAAKGYEVVVKLLIEEGAAVDSVDTEYSLTPLAWAAANRHKAVVKLLLEKGAAGDSVDESGRILLL